MSRHLELGIQLENFRECHELMIPPGTTNYKAIFELYDSEKRMLALTVRIIARKGGALKVSISLFFLNFKPFFLSLISVKLETS